MNAKSYNENPLRKANFISRFFFWWLKDIISLARKTDLKHSDIYDTMPEDLSEPLRLILERAWEKELEFAKSKSMKPSLTKVIIKTYCWTFLKISSLPACYIILCLILPELYGMIMAYFSYTSTTSTLEAYLYATIFNILMIIQCIMQRYGHFQLTRLGMQIKIACSSMIYKKITKLRCSLSSDQKSTLAISLLSIDVGRFEMMACYFIYIIILPAQLFGVTYLIYSYVGLIASISSVALMLLQTIPLQMLYYKLVLRLKTKQAANTDKRISLIDEIVSGIRLIKMYSWEDHFEKRTFLARGVEVEGFLKISYLTLATNTFVMLSHRVSSFIVNIVCILQFRLIAMVPMLVIRQHLFNLRMNLSLFCFSAVRAITNLRVSIKRIEEFLSLPEVYSSAKEIDNKHNDGTVLINNVTAFWCEDSKTEILKNINIDFLPKKMYAILGITGCGKSSLLKLILGELEPTSGQVSVGGKISFASQEPWLFAASIRDNIIFGKTYEKERYINVVNACALLEDFDQLPYGDETLVSDRGISLSGGQCARISLARAVYREADIYLLDDPFAAVDSCVAKTLKKQCIDGFLKDKTVILVTHNLQYLNKRDNIILLNEGKIQFEGSMIDFQKSNEYPKALFISDTDDYECLEKMKDANVVRNGNLEISIKSNNTKPVKSEEIMAQGVMSKSVIFKYIKAGSYGAILVVLVAQVLPTILMYAFDIEMAVWSDEESQFLLNQSAVYTSTDDQNESELNWIPIEKLIIIIGCILVLILSTSVIADILSCRFFFNANRNLHNRGFSHLIRTQLRFFEINPAGQILNRFSEDIGDLDNAIPEFLINELKLTFIVFGSFVFILIVGWWNFLTVIITLSLFVKVGWIYVIAFPKIKRLANTAKSPVLNFVKSTLVGLTTIRSCNAERFVMEEFDSCLNKHTAAYNLEIAIIWGFATWIDILSISSLACTAYICIGLKSYGVLAGQVGLSLMTINESIITLSYLVRLFGETYGLMVNVERILQYTELKSEQCELNNPNNQMMNVWPSKGEILFKHIYLSYSEKNQTVLNDLCFSIKAGTKVGIVGRTGAGKSSLITALFHLAKLDGQLFIDSIDTQTVSLSSLRSKISIIPQEPVLFDTSIRSNLDPLSKYEDSILWSALDCVGLKTMFSSLEKMVGRGGKNLSAGQRQLLCLARVVVKNNKILVLDEATANIDLATEAFIQETIRNKFKNYTVLIIAHRLNTIMDCDKVIVMNCGKVAEYDHPHVLLENHDGHFSKMVEQTGKTMSQYLKVIAEQAYKDMAIQSTYC